MIGQRRRKQTDREKQAAYNVATLRAGGEMVGKRAEGGFCELCGAPGIQRHHRQGRDPFNTTPANLLAVCPTHHADIGRDVARSTDLGLIVPDWAWPHEYPLFLHGRWWLRTYLGDDVSIDDFEADRRIDGDWPGVSIHDLREES